MREAHRQGNYANVERRPPSGLLRPDFDLADTWVLDAAVTSGGGQPWTA